MIRNWKTLALYSLLAVAPVAAPAPVVAAGGADEKATQKRVDDLITSMTEAIKALNHATQGIGELKKDVRATQSDIQNLTTTAIKLRADVDGSATRIDDLQKLISNLDAEVKHLRKRLNESSFPSAPPSIDKVSLDELKRQLASIEQAIRNLRPTEPTSRVALSPPAATSKVVITNLYNEDLLFVINQKRHRVPPGAAVNIEVPAGPLVYEVISGRYGLVRPPTMTNLPANETLTLTAALP